MWLPKQVLATSLWLTNVTKSWSRVAGTPCTDWYVAFRHMGAFGGHSRSNYDTCFVFSFPPSVEQVLSVWNIAVRGAYAYRVVCSRDCPGPLWDDIAKTCSALLLTLTECCCAPLGHALLAVCPHILWCDIWHLGCGWHGGVEPVFSASTSLIVDRSFSPSLPILILCSFGWWGNLFSPPVSFTFRGVLWHNYLVPSWWSLSFPLSSPLWR